MDNEVATDNVIDTTISHNTGCKLLDNVTFNNSHKTWNNSANKVPFSNKCPCATLYINDTQLETLMNKDTINVEHTLVKVSSQVPRNRSLKIFHHNIRGLEINLTNYTVSNIMRLPHILCLSEHHLSENELQLIHLTNYSLGANYCKKTFLKGGVSIFVYRNLQYTP